MENNFQDSFEQVGGLDWPQFQVLFNLATCSINSKLCQGCNVSFFGKGEYSTFKNGKCQLLKMATSRYIAILINS